MFWSYFCYTNHLSINKRNKNLFGDLQSLINSLIIHLFRSSVWFVLLKRIFMSQCRHKLNTLISATCACRFNKQWYKWVLYIILISSFLKSNELKAEWKSTLQLNSKWNQFFCNWLPTLPNLSMGIFKSFKIFRTENWCVHYIPLSQSK